VTERRHDPAQITILIDPHPYVSAGLVLGTGYWLLESATHLFVFGEGAF
jgi:hypothetical protein